jgi:hypothetical protein
MAAESMFKHVSSLHQPLAHLSVNLQTQQTGNFFYATLLEKFP